MTGPSTAITQLARTLAQAGVDADPVLLAEILWLATHSADDSSADPVAQQEEAPPDTSDQNIPVTPDLVLPPPDPHPAAPRRDVQPPAPQQPTNVTALQAQPVASRTNTGVDLRLPVSAALPNRLRLAQALRPFKRRHPTSRSSEFDVDATVELYGQTGLLVPLQKPALERWFDVTLVLDSGPTMDVWRQTTTELTHLLAGHGAFRTVQRLHLIDDAGKHGLYTDAGRKVRLRQTSNTGGRHLIMVVSDCVGPVWYRDDLWQSVRDWAKHGPVVFVQTLPARLWQFSALGPADALVGGGFRPGQPTSSLRTVLPWWSAGEFDDTGVVPVIALTEPDLARWARMVMGGADAQVPGVPAFAPEPSFPAEASPQSRVSAFKATVSLEAYQLAVCLSAIPVQLPVARIVQHAVVGSHDVVHLAEIFAGGLLRKETPMSADIPPDDVVYDFLPGVREVLQRSLTGTRTLEIFRALAQYLKPTVGVGTSYAALLAGGPDEADVAPEFRAFADIGRPLVERFGLAEPAVRPVAQVPPALTMARAAALRAARRRTTFSPMRVSQPMLFVGLGGTGCKVGVELEKRLRDQLCGPDGTALVPVMSDPDFLPYQLPSCLQFVYVDLNETSVSSMRDEARLGREHDQAVRKTRHQITDLVPADLDSAADTLRSLRNSLTEEVIDWLPPWASDSPNVAVSIGAGQLPTVGRSVLFEAIRRDPDNVVAGIKNAVRDIDESAHELRVASGGRTRSVDVVTVFVAFSVAGGTGAGLFYDYLHLIGDLMRQAGKKAEIYPLVLMPSAFGELAGSKRPMELNAGSALIDLFRLIDEQNAMPVHDPIFVRYPELGEVRLLPGVMQTALLFGAPSEDVRGHDLTQSIASLIISMIGAGTPDDDGFLFQTFVDGFINSNMERHAPADTGIGRRGVTTSRVATLTTPLGDLVDVISSHLLANAVNALLKPSGVAETNKQHLRQFIAASGLNRQWEAAPAPIPEYGNVVGYDAVMSALTDRASAMRDNIDHAQRWVSAPASEVARDFDPFPAAAEILQSVDPFRLARTIFGHDDLADPVDQGGFLSLLDHWCAPAGSSTSVPIPEQLDKKLFQQLRLSDPSVQTVLRRQDDWYVRQARRVWNEEWIANRRMWNRPWQVFSEQFRAIHEEFVTFARLEQAEFAQRSQELSRRRTGMAYFLPFEDGGLKSFYRRVLGLLRLDPTRYVPPNADEGHVLNLLLDEDDWADAFEMGRHEPAMAVAHIRQRVKEAIAERLGPYDGRRRALVPRIRDVLVNATREQDGGFTDADLTRFRRKIAELMPGEFVPERHRSLKVLITYPSDEPDAAIERWLRAQIRLPEAMEEPDFVPVQTDAIDVVLMHSSMGITETPECRRVIQLWAEARDNRDSTDRLEWRRRLSQDCVYVVMTRDDRRRALHRLLCAVWNGVVTFEGDLASPRSISIQVGGDPGASMRLDLEPLDELSSWASVLLAYERWVLADDQPVRRALAGVLMSSGAAPTPPAPLFDALLELEDQELGKVFGRSRRHADRLRLEAIQEFWSELLPAALEQIFYNGEKSLAERLRQRWS